MWLKHGFRFILILGLSMMLWIQGLAQDDLTLSGAIIVTDIGSPRGLAFDTDGNLWIADAGVGGDTVLNITVDDSEQTINAGLTGRVIQVAMDGTASDVIVGLPSYYTSPERSNGLYRVIPREDAIWLVYSGNGRFSFGAYWMNTIVELDATTLSPRTIINLEDFEHVNNPDGNAYDTNVADIAWADDGTMYIVDAAGNDLLSWTVDGGLQLVTAWQANPVPTAIEIADNGDLYISFLGEGMADGVATIERWSDGELVETFTGLTAVTDILLDGDVLYAVEFVNYVDDVAGAGRLVQVSSDGITTVADNLIAPFGIAQDADGALYVTYSAVAFVPDISGGVVKLETSSLNSEPEAVDESDVVLSGVELGREIFRLGKNGAQRCANCHRATTRGFAIDPAPNLEGIADVAGDRVEGLTAEAYLRESILYPEKHIEGVWQAPMPVDYIDLLSDEDVEALVDYMMQLTRES